MGKYRTADIGLLRESFTYDPETGVFIRKRGRKVGEVAGSRNDRGYWVLSAPGMKPLAAHRVAWAIHYGRWPKDQIDHINGNPSDNRICNLREANSMQNCANRNRPISKSSGVLGVTWHKRSGKWMAQIKRNYKGYNLGSFDSKEEAAEAYRKAAAQKHGEFSILHRSSQWASKSLN